MNTCTSVTRLGAEASSMAFARGMLLMALLLALPALITYVELKREKHFLFQVSVQKRAFMTDCAENFKIAYCETIWRTVENLPSRD
jgi:hypothetical protein